MNREITPRMVMGWSGLSGLFATLMGLTLRRRVMIRPLIKEFVVCEDMTGTMTGKNVGDAERELILDWGVWDKEAEKYITSTGDPWAGTLAPGESKTITRKIHASDEMAGKNILAIAIIRDSKTGDVLDSATVDIGVRAPKIAAEITEFTVT